MRTVVVGGIAGVERVERWREHARRLLAAEVPPDQVAWQDGDLATLSLALHDEHRPSSDGVPAEGPNAAATVPMRAPPRLPRASLALFQRVGCHRSPLRLAQMYEALWRLDHGEPHLFELRHDPLVRTLLTLDTQVRREMHKTTAFVRFEPRQQADGETHYAAWFEPDHDALELVAPFFQRRFANMRWSILTPGLCIAWDGHRLTRSPGIAAPPAGAADPLAAAWPVYYANIFNPARLRVDAMVREMPRRYWRNLPEAQAIPQLVADAGTRAQAMLARAHALAAREPAPASVYPSTPGAAPAPTTVDPMHCTRCPHAERATRAVVGVGPRDATIMLVGEQPGDEEDLRGVPFVGPAGAVLDRALAAAGLHRDRLFLTNAVKHFLWTPRGKRRIHKTPGQREMLACRDHLMAELAAVRPRVIVALGTTAAQALLDGTGIQAERGEPLRLPNGRWLILSWHPAYILRRGGDDPRAEPALRHHLALAKSLADGIAAPTHVS